ncbi:hypothetical protein [Noviherbaspirillum suwonense]|jgi:hypothetical protein|uniref:Uncharacterized protein n=1 Tax=Noviherbaspirillum suwonense TaxID=1224511 RepID=A0ABY1QNN6_9BURK|nr:hypothetical protein [Noviherbaspirillum suwonense]SMP75754.1 hypothetical protein SAMN06295970_12357 [Noviherbaspirillum suwonense]
MFKKTLPILALFLSSAAMAADTTVNVTDFYADPNDVIIGGTKSSTCGGSLYNVPRSNTNFREVFDLALAAKLASRQVRLYYTSCQGDRAIITHVMLVN